MSIFIYLYCLYIVFLDYTVVYSSILLFYCFTFVLSTYCHNNVNFPLNKDLSYLMTMATHRKQYLWLFL